MQGSGRTDMPRTLRSRIARDGALCRVGDDEDEAGFDHCDSPFAVRRLRQTPAAADNGARREPSPAVACLWLTLRGR